MLEDLNKKKHCFKCGRSDYIDFIKLTNSKLTCIRCLVTDERLHIFIAFDLYNPVKIVQLKENLEQYDKEGIDKENISWREAVSLITTEEEDEFSRKLQEDLLKLKKTCLKCKREITDAIEFNGKFSCGSCFHLKNNEDKEAFERDIQWIKNSRTSDSSDYDDDFIIRGNIFMKKTPYQNSFLKKITGLTNLSNPVIQENSQSHWIINLIPQTLKNYTAKTVSILFWVTIFLIICLIWNIFKFFK